MLSPPLSSVLQLANEVAPNIAPLDLDAPMHDSVDGLLTLPVELIIVILERLKFEWLLSLRCSCVRLREITTCVTRVVLHRKEQLYVPLLQHFGPSLIGLELEGAMSEWLPRLGCVLGVLPRLQRLFIRRAKLPRGVGSAPLPLGETATLAIAGALQAGACRQLHHLNIDERLSEERVMIVAREMRPDAGLLFGASHGYEAVIDEMLRRGASVDATLEDGGNPLIVASYHGGAPVQRLLSHGADVCATRHDGVSALIMASNRGHTRTVDALIEAKADVNAAMREGTPSPRDDPHPHSEPSL